ncbi:hypothetical protein [Nocardioides bizhenqiangii]|uniref:Uncharacterized protein n=1 Tax=Nocardioides bizhenqiangii TaxID=3095076 RepID=A0ABZ0ZY84_9ACTN|nr:MULTISPECIES: hypothetical protein [unclassified Nocardioides]WQQ28711.1 hypothetical protein SHK19_10890 [Nocardioides sp. HM61]
MDLTIVTKNLRALQGALEHSLTIQRTRLQEIVDDLVSRGSLSRAEADGFVNQLLSSSKDYSQALLQVLDSVTAETRKTIGAGVVPVMATAGKTAGRIADTVRQVAKSSHRAPHAATRPGSDRTGGATNPLPDYDDLTVAEIKPRLTGLSPSELRKVREVEKAGKARKSVLSRIDQLLLLRS